MLKQTAQSLNPTRVADAALAASRQVWLAGLGAAIVTRDWARDDAGSVFRSLVKEGASVETRAIRAFGERVNASLAAATSAWNKARSRALTTANAMLETAVTAFPKLKAPAPARRAATKAHKAMPRRNARKQRRGRRAAAHA
jgi:Poly(hydroxyalcanoate) granule associated protein (phasin)